MLVPYPFTDLTGSKLRPAVVLAALDRGDLMLCQLTSNPYADPRAIRIDAADLMEGELTVTSYARPGKLFTGNARLVRRRLAAVGAVKFEELTDAIVALLKP